MGLRLAEVGRFISITVLSWDDAQAYVSWLSRTAGATYRLPTEAEWERAAAGSQRGCDYARTQNRGTCPVGSYGANSAGLSDMVGNLDEWTEGLLGGLRPSLVARRLLDQRRGVPAARHAHRRPRRRPGLHHRFPCREDALIRS